jgi:GNAT superfamily N-acetyltransferase
MTSAPTLPRPLPLPLHLRAGTPPDALCLSVLAIQVFLDTYATEGIREALAREVMSTYSEPEFRRHLADADTRLVLAESAGHLVGFAQVQLGLTHELAPQGAQSQLLRLYVQERFTGKGVGARLLHEAEVVAAGSSSTVLWLTHWVHNHRARAFYARQGYDDCGLTHFVFEGESHENRVCAKRLAAASQ